MTHSLVDLVEEHMLYTLELWMKCKWDFDTMGCYMVCRVDYDIVKVMLVEV